MNAGDILRIIMVLGGIYLFIVTTVSLARQKMTEEFCLAWGFFSLILVVGGILLRPVGISKYISTLGLVLILLIGVMIVLAMYFISCQISELTRKTRELSMQVALLNQENEQILECLRDLQSEKENG